MAPEDMGKTTYRTYWGTSCYQVMPIWFEECRRNLSAMVTLFHDMMHKKIEVYVDDMIVKSKTEEDHIV
jgi:hypothetical protein